MASKIVRTICIFTDDPDKSPLNRLNELEEKLTVNGFQVQTKRLCAKDANFGELEKTIPDNTVVLGLGAKDYDVAYAQREDFYKSRNFFNIECAKISLELKHTGPRR